LREARARVKLSRPSSEEDVVQPWRQLVEVFAPQASDPDTRAVREQWLSAMLVMASAVGLPMMILAAAVSFWQGQTFFALGYAAVFFGILAVTLSGRRLPFGLRGAVFVGIGLGAGALALWRVGLGGTGLLFIVVFIVAGAVLFGSRVGLLLAGVGLLILAVIGSVMVSGLWRPEIAVMLTSTGGVHWVLAGLLVLFATVAIGITPHMFARALGAAARERERHLAELQETAARLVEQTQRSHRAESEVAEGERRFRELIDLLPEAVCETDLSGRVTFLSRAGQRASGYTPEDVSRGLSAADLFASDEHDSFSTASEALRRGESRGLAEYQGRRKDGTSIPVLVRSTPISRDGQIVGIRSLVIDVSEQRRLEDRLNAAARLEAIGTLAGGVAHDFNNLLMSMQGHVSLLETECAANASQREALRAIAEAIGSGAKLTQQLLGFARSGRRELLVTDFNEVVLRTFALFSRTNKALRSRLELTAERCVVEIDRAQIERALLNLLVNAAQAMPGGGEICVSTAMAVPDPATRRRLSLGAAGYVMARVADTGVGMDAQTLKHLFEPFFTTKERGRGTGLGLATSYGIVRAHDGAIDVASTAGVGSTFTIWLPLSEKTPTGEARSAVAPPPRGSGTLLIIDDEAAVARVSGRLLERLGYEVLIAGSGEAGIELYRQHRDVIALVVLDFTMPGLSGAETFDRLRAFDPEVKVLLASGYGPDQAVEQLLARGCRGLVQKPYRPEEIAEKIAAILRA
jgi:PAS domain S-box-containing protein